ncbi:hypothetical protein BO219_06410 [Anoxybacillus kestanbolensis]|uniref:Uncharacterized protein n=2 Tax=Anoxybacillus kestanbolensis TaxID=227476 RepID=A0A1V3FTZ5_9BACL|nr:hypothetical protein BO219_06410 [Anoxybacillus kestanbolensis]
MMKTVVIGMNYGKTPSGERKSFKGMLVENEIVPTLIVCDQHGWEYGCRRENYRTLVNARVVSVSEGNECVLGEYVLEADEIKEDVM